LGIVAGAASVATLAAEHARAGREVAIGPLSHPEARRLARWFRGLDDFWEAPSADLDLAEWKFLHTSGGSVTVDRPPLRLDSLLGSPPIL
jgi:hypothetical protein